MLLAIKDTYGSAHKLENATLEELMVEMLRYGHPRLSHIQGGWYCIVEMNTNTVGAKFDISSDFKQPTPLHAARQCHERILTALKELTK